MLYSVKRKYADKRLNYQSTYVLRSDLVLLAQYVNNWQQLLLERYDKFKFLSVQGKKFHLKLISMKQIGIATISIICSMVSRSSTKKTIPFSKKEN